MNGSFIFIEIVITAFFILCVYHSFKRGKNFLIELITISIYGLLLEILGISMSNSYIYGDFTLKIFEAPISVSLAWGVIIYTAMVTVERLEVGQKARPFMVALLALNIDLSMDAIAIREGLWMWEKEASFFWFDVPSVNFLSWFIVAFSFSFFIYYFRKNKKVKKFYPILCLFLSLIILFLVEIFQILWLLPTINDSYIIFVIVIYICVISLIIVVLKKGVLKKNNNLDFISSFLPIGFHLYFLLLLLFSDYKTLELVIVSLSMTLIGIYVHFLPSMDIIKKRINMILS